MEEKTDTSNIYTEEYLNQILTDALSESPDDLILFAGKTLDEDDVDDQGYIRATVFINEDRTGRKIKIAYRSKHGEDPKDLYFDGYIE